MKDFKNLLVWKKAHEMTLDVYQATKALPKEETYGLTSQLRRAASSVPANIAEGCGRNSDAELAHFLQIAASSASEVEYHLLLARDLKFIDSKEHENLTSEIIEIKKMLNAFLKKLRAES